MVAMKSEKDIFDITMLKNLNELTLVWKFKKIDIIKELPNLNALIFIIHKWKTILFLSI